MVKYGLKITRVKNQDFSFLYKLAFNIQNVLKIYVFLFQDCISGHTKDCL